MHILGQFISRVFRGKKVKSVMDISFTNKLTPIVNFDMYVQSNKYNSIEVSFHLRLVTWWVCGAGCKMLLTSYPPHMSLVRLRRNFTKFTSRRTRVIFMKYYLLYEWYWRETELTSYPPHICPWSDYAETSQSSLPEGSE